MSKKHKNVCIGFNYIDHSLIPISTITVCVSISAFATLVGIPIGITNALVWLKICVITAGMKNCKSTIKEKRKWYDEIVLLAKCKLNSIEVLISKVLCSHDEFILINNVRKEFHDMREEIKYSCEK